jgi:pyruvate/2-oxoglutarate dehydrogenase complex dihydrolipoamide acyltransferase (E2) component
MKSVAMPQLGESVDEGTVVRWLKNVGDAIAVDEVLFEVASDKVNMEIPSLNAGILSEILVPEGATVPVGTMLAHIASDADAGCRKRRQGTHHACRRARAPRLRSKRRSVQSDSGAHRRGGSTFTITNNGAFGTLLTAAIINLPNVAILSTDAIDERVVPRNGMIAIRRRMYLCMSWDHCAFDGSTAAKFLGAIKRDLEERDWRGQF